uniref:Uncharacterized protein n=1 Tax=Arundo donax TaxID=35708 RepID=A0A0A8YRT1_ARUDO
MDFIKRFFAAKLDGKHLESLKS